MARKHLRLLTVLLLLTLFSCAAKTSARAENADANERKVAFVISEGAALIDFAGPWEVFQDSMLCAMTEHKQQKKYKLFTVAESAAPVTVSGGMRVLPDYSFQNAPQPDLIVVPAQHNASQTLLKWVANASKSAQLTMSVCNGAFVLADAGLLNGKSAALHHDFYQSFSARYPDVKVVRGVRYVDSGNIATAGGLTSGIDLALHAVAKFDGPDLAQKTADLMEYASKGWENPDSSKDASWLTAADSKETTVDSVCGMSVPSATDITYSFANKTYRFCSDECKERFIANPEKYSK